ncbi:MAG TPA: hypothetical protein VLG40_02715 [Candidatus Saccharimonas sp.]|nr:hypothetical protein [Candidatus Saccharimonas sp.]
MGIFARCQRWTEPWDRYIATGLLDNHTSRLIKLPGLTFEWQLVSATPTQVTWRRFRHDFDGSIVACAKFYYSFVGAHIFFGLHISGADFKPHVVGDTAITPELRYVARVYTRMPDGDTLDLGQPFTDDESLRLLFRPQR